MNNLINNFYKNQSLFYKMFLYLIATVTIVYLFPKGSKFKYDFTKGKPWQHENLYSPFDFAILKSEEEIAKEQDQIKANQIPYFNYSTTVPNEIKENLDERIKVVFSDSILRRDELKIKTFSRNTLNEIYEYGILNDLKKLNENSLVYLKKGNEAQEVVYKNILNQEEISNFLDGEIENSSIQEYSTQIKQLFFDILKPNVSLNEELTEKDLQSKLNSISYTKGSVPKGSRIIERGEIINNDTYRVLTSLKTEYESKVWTSSSYFVVVIGYFLLVSLALLMLFLFIKKYRYDIFENNTKMTFIVFNILWVVFLTVTVMKINVDYVYVVPLCILPLTLKAFFDPRLGLFTHVITVLILGFVVPNSYEYMFLQIIAGIVTILTISELYKRANLFISVGQITGVYIFAYLAFTIIQEGDFEKIDYVTLLMFVLGGFATLFVQPLIYAYEKLFGLVSDMSLLELSDTNSKLLKELSNQAPGTFHHSLNVANLAEAAASEIGANAMLVRVGALYHDIGKMHNPTYFTENQSTSVNPHEELDPHESAEIIINHVKYGIERAKRNNLPDRIIDFIRTHHGTTLVYYFYKLAQEKAKETGEVVNEEDFKYPGPIPFSKETAILMMSDSLEAATKSIKDPNASLIDEYVEKIIDKQMEENQFLNANITFKEIRIVKKIFKRKLKNIYHLRIEYPE
ncbi:HD family phosphohydrolase [Mesonia sp. K7]|uniref:HD family phosphohydrolase n=1 Tax=Mesonia sp. K7 TaxID=2218606 RepID=UPI000DAA35CB|nr:HDIG domain-containing metalloprotein [Mesonia sp. K7]PZD79326.1 phosphohydrolase [Mesonia sp. K7]